MLNNQTMDKPRIGVVVAAHTPLATALLDAAKHIVGGEGADMIATVDMDGASVDAVHRAVTSVAGPGGVLILADLFGGTAANVALAQLGEGRVEVVTGANLAMLLEAITHRNSTENATVLAARVAKSGRTSVVVASEILNGDASSHRLVA